MLNELTVYQKHYDLILYAFPIIAQYPRNARFTLGQETQMCMLGIARLIVRANAERDRRRRLDILWSIDRGLQELRLLTRLAKDMKMISVRRYGNISARVTEVGRLVGGWIKSTTNRK
jgi:four helix bundle protein